MKTTLTFILRISLILTLNAFAFTSCTNDGPKATDDTENVSDDSYANVEASAAPCNCESSWFPHSQTPEPLEGKGSPFDTISTTNCIFHQWSWQKFLWLTKPIEDEGVPLFLFPSIILQVDDKLAFIQEHPGANVVLQYTEQAGPDAAILTTNPAYNGSQEGATIFYSLHASRTMYQAANNFRSQLADGTLPADNFEAFPVGSLELKVSWVMTQAIPQDKQANYYTTTGAVSQDGGETFTNTSVSMIGMHVVGVVENHPEFIWATFEHNDIAPNYDWSANVARSSTDKLLFGVGSISGLDGILYDTSTQAAVVPSKVYDLFQYGVPQDGDGFLTTSQSEPENFNNIQNINNCVAGKLDNNDPFKNYFYNGSIWLNTDSLTSEQQAQLIVNLSYGIGDAKPGSSARGSLNSANVSMETFTQTFQKDISDIAVKNLTNCFSCHSGDSFQGNKSPIYMSHIFDGSINADQGKTDKEISDLKRKQQKLQLDKQLK